MQEILFRGRRTLLIGATILLLAAMSPSAVRSAPTTINFEHRGNGIAWVGNNISVPVNEYANQGVLITADLGAINPGRASLFLNNGNIGTVNIHGYAISHGATAGADTFLNFQFSSHVIDLAFDWSSSTVASGIIVSLYNRQNILIRSITSPATLTERYAGNGNVFQAGHFSAPLSNEDVWRVQVDDDPLGIHAITIDNLQFTSQVPEPAVWLCFGVGAAVLNCRRRKFPRRGQRASLVLHAWPAKS